MRTKVTELLSIEFPVIQGGLAHLAYHELASAVSNAGGLGQLTAMSMEGPAQLEREIRLVKQRTSKPYGVNFAIGQHGRSYEEMLTVALDNQVPVISITGGNPTPLLDKVKGTGIHSLVLVSSKRQAIKAEQLGASAVMVVGNEGGGHLGRDEIGTMVLIPSVVDAVSIPVIAAGGIADGRGLMAALALGADGVEMGTRFIATKECVLASKNYKEDIIKMDENSTVIIKKTLGAPARALSNNWTNDIIDKEKRGYTYDQLKTLISGQSNKAYIHEGRVEDGFGWAGQCVGIIHDEPTVEELFNRMKQEIKEVKEKWVDM
ncbi:NAD(P)H-dependent flavin oxidoreductase [Mangrovibacillus cuniculi]|uniref:Probable nitronate monooxygenase n=1 Tax=Mangrovibacillus cuniculi TaxID=2593652 RepID=A0A7S8CA75_9BACI|nr:nitronate monooxygenase [Mangrovibacillus cuniculi]QPC46197.1 nitronate monooxygenase [Mangrovibacillus cuniculi]